MARSLDVTVLAIGDRVSVSSLFWLADLATGTCRAEPGRAAGGEARVRQQEKRPRFLPYLIAGVVVLILAARSPMVGLKAYPVLVSLGFAAAFAYSLLWPPTIVERIARFQSSGFAARGKFLSAQGHDRVADVLYHQCGDIRGDRSQREPETVDAVQRINFLPGDGNDVRG